MGIKIEEQLGKSLRFSRNEIGNQDRPTSWLKQFALDKARPVDAAFLAQWRAEVEAMRRGDNPDWFKWTPACRRSWAAAMLDLAIGEGVPEAEITRGMEWLGGIQRVPP